MNPTQTLLGLNQIAPILLVLLGGVAAMMLAVALPHEDDRDLDAKPFLAVSLLASVAAGAWLFTLTPTATPVWNGLLAIDNLSLMSQALLVALTGLSMCIGTAYLTEQGIVRGEYYALTMFSCAGMMLMASASELLTFFIGLEVMSLAVYVLVGFRRADRWSQEASLKYFISGAFASAFFLFGAAMLFGASGSTNYAVIAGIARGGQVNPLFLAGVALCVVGFAFKVAAVPFHMWAPDAYTGAPTTITGFMAVTVKTAAFVALLRFALVATGDRLHGMVPALIPLLGVLAIVTMTVGNLMAVLQKNVKRMLAYSSIAHAGYLLVGLIGAMEDGELGSKGMLFYLLVYSLATLAAFGVLVAFERHGARHEEQSIGRFTGAGFTFPGLGLVFAIAMFSLSGLPPTAGFLGKVMLFAPALAHGHTTLVVIAVLNSVVSVYYYLRVVVAMYMRTAPERPRPGEVFGVRAAPSFWLSAALTCCALLVIYITVAPNRWLLSLSHLFS